MLGFAALWAGTGNDPIVDAPVLAGGLYAALLVTAFITTTIHIGRRVTGIHGRSAQMARMFGAAWFTAFAAFGLLAVGLGRADASDTVTTVFMSALPCFIAGMLYLARGLIWSDSLQFQLGMVNTLVAGVATVVSAPHHHLVLSIAGGGAFLVAAARSSRTTS